jgi:hypothetical protein
MIIESTRSVTGSDQKSLEENRSLLDDGKIKKKKTIRSLCGILVKGCATQPFSQFNSLLEQLVGQPDLSGYQMRWYVFHLL